MWERLTQKWKSVAFIITRQVGYRAANNNFIDDADLRKGNKSQSSELIELPSNWALVIFNLYACWLIQIAANFNVNYPWTHCTMHTLHSALCTMHNAWLQAGSWVLQARRQTCRQVFQVQLKQYNKTEHFLQRQQVHYVEGPNCSKSSKASLTKRCL